MLAAQQATSPDGDWRRTIGGPTNFLFQQRDIDRALTTCLLNVRVPYVQIGLELMLTQPCGVFRVIRPRLS